MEVGVMFGSLPFGVCCVPAAKCMTLPVMPVSIQHPMSRIDKRHAGRKQTVDQRFEKAPGLSAHVTDYVRCQVEVQIKCNFHSVPTANVHTCALCYSRYKKRSRNVGEPQRPGKRKVAEGEQRR